MNLLKKSGHEHRKPYTPEDEWLSPKQGSFQKERLVFQPKKSGDVFRGVNKQGLCYVPFLGCDKNHLQG